MTTGILVYHGKYGDEYFLADTPERLEAAQQYLFQQLDEMGCYHESKGHINVMLVRARLGDIQYIRHFLDTHRNREYEGWDIRPAFDLCE